MPCSPVFDPMIRSMLVKKHKQSPLATGLRSKSTVDGVVRVIPQFKPNIDIVAAIVMAYIGSLLVWPQMIVVVVVAPERTHRQRLPLSAVSLTAEQRR